MGKAGDGYIFAGGDFQRTYPMTGVLRWNPTNGNLQIFYGTWNNISVYTAGNGISINNNEISIDADVVPTFATISNLEETLRTEFNTQIGNINAVLDEINGTEV